jgi:hypothetical protein
MSWLLVGGGTSVEEKTEEAETDSGKVVIFMRRKVEVRNYSEVVGSGFSFSDETDIAPDGNGDRCISHTYDVDTITGAVTQQKTVENAGTWEITGQYVIQGEGNE